MPAQLDAFRLTLGEPKIYFKVGDNGNRRAQAFCADCGSSLYTYAADSPRAYGLRVGCIRERHELIPRKRAWCKSALEWSVDLHGMATKDRD